jgi:hypothetical protein
VSLRPRVLAVRAAVETISGAPQAAVEVAVQAVLSVGYDWGGVEYISAALSDSVREYLLRDIMGNPFRALTAEAAWLERDDERVRRIAASVYEQSTATNGVLEATGLARLADALEDAGCTEASLLDHLRRPGLHVRGCWAVDLVLEKE